MADKTVFRIYDRVMVKKKNLEPERRYHPIGEAIICGRGVGGFQLFFKEHGFVSWYGAKNLELIEKHQPELLDEWEKARR